MVIKMEKVKWVDVKLCDWGKLQVNDIKEYLELRKFYISIIMPLYEPLKNSKTWKFSVPDEELTCRIFFHDLAKYHQENSGVKNMKDLLKIVQKYNIILTDEKIEQMSNIIESNKKVGKR